jgi:hypothetical protein
VHVRRMHMCMYLGTVLRAPCGACACAAHAHVHVPWYRTTRTVRLAHICVPGCTRHVACTVGWRHTGRAVQAHLFVLALTRTLTRTRAGRAVQRHLFALALTRTLSLSLTLAGRAVPAPLHPSPSPNPKAIPNTEHEQVEQFRNLFTLALAPTL